MRQAASTPLLQLTGELLSMQKAEGMRSEFLTERASEHFGMLRAKTRRSHNTSESVYNTTSFTEHEIQYVNLIITSAELDHSLLTSFTRQNARVLIASMKKSSFVGFLVNSSNEAIQDKQASF